ncbi:receptor-like protein 14 [Hibiscus syriacus]|uniref:receptor-like protein 14 n=1 Tax=Hibiscus syriacus TaxID=106335 RepID=UPI0019231D7C|nr:receptor-like protein 14 [Hibiscus syriacus]
MRGTLSNQDLIRLEVLDLRRNIMEGGIPQNIGKISHLKALYLADNYFNGSLPVPVTSYSKPSQNFLRFMDISHNDFEGSFSFSSLFNHSKLDVVVIGSTGNKLQIDNDEQAGIPLFQLKALWFSNCNLKNAPLFLLNRHRLIWVDISHNNLSGALPIWLLENNTDLRFLYLGNGSFIGNLDPLPENPMSRMVYVDVSIILKGNFQWILDCFFQILQYLNLSNNLFVGELRSSVGVMTKLSWLDLSFNNLSGEVPHELVENCIDPVGLMLNNSFHGEFFSTHFNLSGVQVLRLRNNEFTGSLITKKEFYSSMKLFDVSNNNMAGEIPNGIDAEVLLLRSNSFEGHIPCQGRISP